MPLPPRLLAPLAPRLVRFPVAAVVRIAPNRGRVHLLGRNQNLQQSSSLIKPRNVTIAVSERKAFLFRIMNERGNIKSGSCRYAMEPSIDIVVRRDLIQLNFHTPPVLRNSINVNTRDKSKLYVIIIIIVFSNERGFLSPTCFSLKQLSVS
jgi:hypothetical protein